MPTVVLLFALSAIAEKPAASCVCEPPQVVCLPTVEMKTKTHTCYSCLVKTICLTFKPKCGDDCGPCGKPREVRVLRKRFVKEEHPERVCEPVKCP